MLQLSLDFFSARKKPPVVREVTKTSNQSFLWKHGITVRVVRSLRARRYLLRWQPEGHARLVIPRRGSQAEALQFLERSETWLLKRREQWRSQEHQTTRIWQDGTAFLFRGEEVSLGVRSTAKGVELSFGDQRLAPAAACPDYRQTIFDHLRRLAEKELPPRTLQLAALHEVTVKRITVRSQKTRWGSCSARGTISLNWRVIQAPAVVVDYLIIHELMHRREMNHSPRYWKLVAAAFPAYREAELWLKKTRLESLS